MPAKPGRPLRAPGAAGRAPGRRLRERGVDHRVELLRGLRAREQHAVHDESRRAGDADRARGLEVRFDLVLEAPLLDAGPEALGVEPRLARVAQQVLLPERLVVLEQLVVIGPELPLLVRAGGSLGRSARVWMDAVERQMAVDQAHLARVLG